VGLTRRARWNRTQNPKIANIESQRGGLNWFHSGLLASVIAAQQIFDETDETLDCSFFAFEFAFEKDSCRDLPLRLRNDAGKAA
jgi:hypothetical protein